MANTWITDLTHFIDETGGLHRLLSGSGLRLARHMAAIVAAATDQSPRGEAAKVRCRRRPKRCPCPGIIEYRLCPDERIIWNCPLCGDNGVISNWQSTAWDQRETSRVH
jgi:hypothetical protein